MPRVDVWDIPDPEQKVVYDLGFKRGIEEKYVFEIKLGEGGFGSVRVVRSKKSGVQYACKSISKALDVPGLAPVKQQQHLDNIRREIAVLRKLRGTLNVVHLEEVLEDDTHVHIIMEWCRGGDLFQKIGGRHYSEQTVGATSTAAMWSSHAHNQQQQHRVQQMIWPNTPAVTHLAPAVQCCAVPGAQLLWVECLGTPAAAAVAQCQAVTRTAGASASGAAPAIAIGSRYQDSHRRSSSGRSSSQAALAAAGKAAAPHVMQVLLLQDAPQQQEQEHHSNIHVWLMLLLPC
jgi:hypothetical protein